MFRDRNTGSLRYTATMLHAALGVVALAADAAPSGRARSAILLFIIVFALLGLIALSAVLLVLANRRRRQVQPAKAEKPQVDPWNESARRLVPYGDDDDDLPRDDEP